MFLFNAKNFLEVPNNYFVNTDMNSIYNHIPEVFRSVQFIKIFNIYKLRLDIPGSGDSFSCNGNLSLNVNL